MSAGSEGTEKALPEQIKEFLLDGPASIKDVQDNLKIAWATAKAALEGMKDKGEVKEIVSNPKIRIFKLSIDPSFYGVPLTKEQKNDSLFLFQTIRKEWKNSRGNETLLSTTLQKIAVDVAVKCNCGIPHAQFHYGKVVPVFEAPISSFSIEKPQNYRAIIRIVQEELPKHTNNSLLEMDDQYKDYRMVLYQAKQKFKIIIHNQIKSGESLTPNEIETALVSILMNWPSPSDDSGIFSLFSDFVREVHCLIITKKCNENLNKINETFDILWDMITTYLFFKDMEKQISSEKKEIFEYIMSNQLLSKKENAEERINYLHSFVDTNVKVEMPHDEESVEIRRILAEGAEEE